MPKKCANPKENPNKTCISGLLLCQQWLMKASWKPHERVNLTLHKVTKPMIEIVPQI